MIKDLKELQGLMKLCRTQGVYEIKYGSVELKLGELPAESNGKQTIEDKEDTYKNFPKGELTPQQLMFYSAGGVPEDDPALKDEEIA